MVDLFRTANILLVFCSLIPIFAAVLISGRLFLRKRQTHLKIFFIFNLLWIWWGVLQAVYAIVPLILIFGAANIIIAPLGYCMAVLTDAISRDSFDWVKLVILSSLTTGAACGWIFNFPPNIFAYPLTLFTGGIFGLYSLRIAHVAPPPIKPPAYEFFLGAVLAGVVVPTLFNLQLLAIFPSLFPVLVSIGVFLIADAFRREPRIAYVLPFKALRLVVVDFSTGTPLFTHVWERKNEWVGEALFSGMLQGISGILQEVVGKGKLQAIQMDTATLLINRIAGQTIACVLVVTKPTKMLRYSLDFFARRFDAEFRDKFANTCVAGHFSTADRLVAEIFPDIPEYGSGP